MMKVIKFSLKKVNECTWTFVLYAEFDTIISKLVSNLPQKLNYAYKKVGSDLPV